MSRTLIRFVGRAWLGAVLALGACNSSPAERANERKEPASAKGPVPDKAVAPPQAAEAALQPSPETRKAGSKEHSAKDEGKPPAPGEVVSATPVGKTGGAGSEGNPPAAEPPSVETGSKAPPSEKLPAPATLEALPATIRVTLQTQPPVDARVRMGSKRLGTIRARHPLVVERPRDSGPLDLVIRATGFFPVHTRTYTFEDSEVTVKLTSKETPEELYGYQQPLEAPDAGAAPETP